MLETDFPSAQSCCCICTSSNLSNLLKLIQTDSHQFATVHSLLFRSPASYDSAFTKYFVDATLLHCKIVRLQSKECFRIGSKKPNNILRGGKVCSNPIIHRHYLMNISNMICYLMCCRLMNNHCPSYLKSHQIAQLGNFAFRRE